CCCARVVPLRIVNNKLLAQVPADFDNRIHYLREGFLAVCNSVLRHHWSSFRPCNPLTRRSQCPSAPQRPSSMVYTVKVHLQRTWADLMFPPHCQSGRGRNESAVVLVSLIDDARPRASDLHDHSDDRAYHGDQSSC